jgi:hypothetical protein
MQVRGHGGTGLTPAGAAGLSRPVRASKTPIRTGWSGFQNGTQRKQVGQATIPLLEWTDYPVRIRKKFAGEALDGIADELRRSFGRKCRDDFACAIVGVKAPVGLSPTLL